MRSGADVVKGSQAGNTPQMGDASGVDDGHANVVDQLLLNQECAVVDGVEDFADGQGRGCVLSNETEVFLHLRRGRIFEPKQLKFLDALAETRSFNGPQAMMRIMQQVEVESIARAHRI